MLLRDCTETRSKGPRREDMDEDLDARVRAAVARRLEGAELG